MLRASSGSDFRKQLCKKQQHSNRCLRNSIARGRGLLGANARTARWQPCVRQPCWRQLLDQNRRLIGPRELGRRLADVLAGANAEHTSERWSFNQIRNVPNSRAETPLSVAPGVPTPLSVFSISSIMTTHPQLVAIWQFAVFGRQTAGQVLQLIAVGQLSSEWRRKESASPGRSCSDGCDLSAPVPFGRTAGDVRPSLRTAFTCLGRCGRSVPASRVRMFKLGTDSRQQEVCRPNHIENGGFSVCVVLAKRFSASGVSRE
jgi:hypothetical protein